MFSYIPELISSHRIKIINKIIGIQIKLLLPVSPLTLNLRESE